MSSSVVGHSPLACEAMMPCLEEASLPWYLVGVTSTLSLAFNTCGRSEIATCPWPSHGPQSGDKIINGYRASAVLGVPNVGTRSKGAVNPCRLGGHKWAKWLHNPYHLGGRVYPRCLGSVSAISGSTSVSGRQRVFLPRRVELPEAPPIG